MKRASALLLGLPTLFFLSGCFDKKVELKTEDDKVSYIVGYQIAKNVLGQPDFKPNQEALIAALKDTFAKKDPQISQADMEKVMVEFNNKKQEEMKKKMKEMEEKTATNVETGKKFLEENKAKPGIVTTASGLQYKVIQEGKGDKPKATDTVKVHYKGTLIDGTEFDSSYKNNNQPLQFRLDSVIPGWTEALQLMTPGSKYQLFIPSELGYKERPTGNIPGNSVLIFDVELLEIVK